MEKRGEKKERTGKEKGRDKEPGSHGSIRDWLRSPMCILSMFVSPFPRVLTVILSRCERIDAVHASSAGGTHGRKLKMVFFSPLPLRAMVLQHTSA